MATALHPGPQLETPWCLARRAVSLALEQSRPSLPGCKQLLLGASVQAMSSSVMSALLLELITRRPASAPHLHSLLYWSRQLTPGMLQSMGSSVVPALPLELINQGPAERVQATKPGKASGSGHIMQPTYDLLPMIQHDSDDGDTTSPRWASRARPSSVTFSSDPPTEIRIAAVQTEDSETDAYRRALHSRPEAFLTRSLSGTACQQPHSRVQEPG